MPTLEDIQYKNTRLLHTLRTVRKMCGNFFLHEEGMSLDDYILKMEKD